MAEYQSCVCQYSTRNDESINQQTITAPCMKNCSNTSSDESNSEILRRLLTISSTEMRKEREKYLIPNEQLQGTTIKDVHQTHLHTSTNKKHEYLAQSNNPENTLCYDLTNSYYNMNFVYSLQHNSTTNIWGRMQQCLISEANQQRNYENVWCETYGTNAATFNIANHSERNVN